MIVRYGGGGGGAAGEVAPRVASGPRHISSTCSTVRGEVNNYANAVCKTAVYLLPCRVWEAVNS